MQIALFGRAIFDGQVCGFIPILPQQTGNKGNVLKASISLQ